ncbi:MAG: cupin domain-containing protein [Bauldia sp.]|nr:cupin domain-containing protein [Bauldia sp.]MCW5718318.1 cupin domain-containing protein [Bauldia sp.]
MINLHRGGAIAALVAVLGTAGIATAFAQPAAPAAETGLPETYATLLTPLYSGKLTIVGQEIAYPTGTPLVTGSIVTIAPGAETGWHTHEVPLFVYVLEGTVTVDYGSKGVRAAGPGSSFMEAMNWPHNATNHGDVPVRILAVYIGEEGVANADTAAGAE